MSPDFPVSALKLSTLLMYIVSAPLFFVVASCELC